MLLPVKKIRLQQAQPMDKKFNFEEGIQSSASLLGNTMEDQNVGSKTI
jgi:hypothetical protein